MKETFSSELVPVRRGLESWRRRRRGRQAIPEALWRQMARLAREHGVSRVSQALRLDYYALKRRTQEDRGEPEFIEVKVGGTGAGLSQCVAELEDRQGRKLVLRWGSAPGPEFLGMVEVFWKQGA